VRVKEYYIKQGTIEEDDEHTKGFKSCWIVAFVVGRKDDAFLGMNIELGCKKEYPFRWEL